MKDAEQQQEADLLIRSGTPVSARDFICPCGEEITVRIPGKPAGVHAPFVVIDDAGEVVAIRNVWVHGQPGKKGRPSPRCWAKALKALFGDETEGEEEDPAPTPLRPKRAEKPEPDPGVGESATAGF